MSYRWWSLDTVKVVKKSCKSILHRFTDAEEEEYSGYTINPYVGCAHRCVYCYATYKWAENFYDIVKAKHNAVEVLAKDIIEHGRKSIESVFLSSATDCYQPVEGRYKITRKCIELLQKIGISYTIITKSSSIVRDIDLHKRYRDKCIIIWSLTTINEEIKQMIEPYASPAHSVIKALEIFSKNGIKVGVNIDPIIPGLTDGEDELKELVDKIAKAGASFASSAIMRLRRDIWDRMRRLLLSRRIYDVIRRIEEIYFKNPVRMGYYYLAHPRYSIEKLEYVKNLVEAHGIQYGFPGENKNEIEHCYVKASELRNNQRPITLYI